MKRSIILTITGLCCAICMAQSIDSTTVESLPLDTNRIIKEWHSITAECCAQHLLAFDTDSKLSKNERNTLKNAPHWESLKSITTNESQFIYKYYLVLDSIRIDTISNPISAWDSLFHVFTAKDYPSLKTSEQLKADLTSEYTRLSSGENADGNTFKKLLTGKKTSWTLLVILVILVIYICIRIASLKKELKTVNSQLKGLTKESHRESATSINRSANTIPRLNERVEQLEKEIRAIKQSRANSVSITPKKEETITSSPIEESHHRNKEPYINKIEEIIVYLKNHKDGVMKECAASDAQFKLTLPNHQTTVGEFSFAGDANKAIATKDATFDDICDLENWSMSAKSLSTVEKGTAERISDSSWKVIKRATIKFN